MHTPVLFQYVIMLTLLAYAKWKSKATPLMPLWQLLAFLHNNKVTWTMEPLFIPGAAANASPPSPIFCGQSTTAAEAHRNRFESAAAYGAHDFKAVSQTTGEINYH